MGELGIILGKVPGAIFKDSEPVLRNFSFSLLDAEGASEYFGGVGAYEEKVPGEDYGY